LLVHTAEVLNLCKAIVEACGRYDFINRDVLYASAILHDIGKVETYMINDIGAAEVLPTEGYIGHIFYGMNLAQTVGQELGTNPEFVNEVIHCIASHHGSIEWGSVKPVQSVEAGILSRIDYISSRNGMVEKSLQENVKSGQPLRDEFRIYGDHYFASMGMKKYITKEK
jgi:3'-5' exoribonuclease